MRGYQCVVYTRGKNDLQFSPITNYACWGGLSGGQQNNKDIYIGEFDDPSTRKFVRRFLWNINQITPCSIISAKPDELPHYIKLSYDNSSYKTLKNPNESYINLIKFRMLSNYENSLILLNFIRNLWHDPGVQGDLYNREPIPTVPVFFKALRESHKLHTDPLERLTYANIEMSKEYAKSTPKTKNYSYCSNSPGHCNIHDYKKLKIRTKTELIETNLSTYAFLMGISDE